MFPYWLSIARIRQLSPAGMTPVTQPANHPVGAEHERGVAPTTVIGRLATILPGNHWQCPPLLSSMPAGGGSSQPGEVAAAMFTRSADRALQLVAEVTSKGIVYYLTVGKRPTVAATSLQVACRKIVRNNTRLPQEKQMCRRQ